MDTEELLALGLIGFAFYMYIQSQNSKNNDSIAKEIGKDIGGVINDVKNEVTNAADQVKSFFDRGVGRIPDRVCPDGKVNYAGLCYSLPSNDWYVSAPGFIAKKCPAGWRDDGTTCWLDAETYGRGVGYPWKFGDALNLDGARSRCENDHGRGNCEKYGEIYYPKCRPGFHPSGCCTCIRDTQTQSKQVTAQIGSIPGAACNADEELDGGLCYKKQK